MSLYRIWKENPDQIRDKRVDQIISFAGDGKLGDKNTGSSEFRGLLARVPGHVLARYAEECLAKSFPDSGLALQDIVNELARKIGFEVEPGRYRGTRNSIGHDGIWKGPDGHQIVAEVKTSDAYRLPIEIVAGYRSALIEQGTLTEAASSILIIVGREDTGELESQIRGSRHAWDVRLISIDALIRLMDIRQELDDPKVEARIRSLLVPREYTRLDEIIDLVFSTTQDLLEDSSHTAEDLDGEVEVPRAKPVAFNDACADRIAAHLGVDLAKESRTTYSDVDQGVVVNCAVSKEYPATSGAGYWFALHPHQLEKLRGAANGYAAYGCGAASQIALLPLDFIESQLYGMNQTQREDSGSYWHIQIQRKAARWFLQLRKGEDWPDITRFMLFSEPVPK